ncbi:MAG: hypothetical protein NZ571_16305, partial [Anaerolineae bacterium]|nr:hypothetical protein [Anaerolineae bacterium]
TSLEDRPRYTPTTTFETFPMPYPPGREPTESPEYKAIAEVAAELHRVREAWLNPPEVLESPQAAQGAERLLKDRTLTNLYNAVEAYRTGRLKVRIPSAAREIAPQIAALHDRLDRAVLAAYGWLDLADQLRTDSGREEILRRLLEENLRRAAVETEQAHSAEEVS